MSTKQTHLTYTSNQTRSLGEQLAKKIFEQKPQEKAIVIALQGDLGGGKTTFLQGFAKGLGVKEKILSPTFVILKKFKITKIKNQKSRPTGARLASRTANIKNTNQKSKIKKFSNFYHIDCYRIENPGEILELGFKEIIADPQNIIAIEWAEKIRKILPQDCPRLIFDFINATRREIAFKNFQFFNFQTFSHVKP